MRLTVRLLDAKGIETRVSGDPSEGVRVPQGSTILGYTVFLDPQPTDVIAYIDGNGVLQTKPA
jgi:hypothetical protein